MGLVCYFCHKSILKAEAKRCGRCLLVIYCSKECQTHSWKLSHKHSCVPNPTVLEGGAKPEKFSLEWAERQVDKHLSKWIQLWSDSLRLWTTIALNFPSHPSNRNTTHCMRVVIQPIHLQDEAANQYKVLEASVMEFAKIIAENPDLRVKIDPEDTTRLRFVVLLVNDDREPRRLRLFQWNDLALPHWRSMKREAANDLAENWDKALTYAVENMSPDAVHEMLSQNRGVVNRLPDTRMNGVQTRRKLRVAIVGGGMGGLTFAASLRKIDPSSVDINLYEAASDITEIGAGISLWRRTWAALRQMGLEEPLCQTLQYRPTDDPELIFELRRGDNAGLVHRVYCKGGLMTFHRHALQQTLLRNIPEFCNVHLSHRLISYTESADRVVLRFQTGETTECDLLIGADGLKSVVRNGSPTHFGPSQLVWLGRFAYRALVPAEKLREVDPLHRALDIPVNYLGKNAHVIAYPISGKTIINVIGYYTDPAKEGTVLSEPSVREATKDEIIAKYKGWTQEVITLFECVDKALRLAIQALQPLNTYATDRVALLGDAAHAMAPHLGGGAGQAMEDAWILSTLISSLPCTPQIVPAVLRRYNEIRKPVGNKILNDSRNQGRLFELSPPEFRNAMQLSDEQYEHVSRMIEAGLKWGEDPGPLMEDGIRALSLNDEVV